MRTPSSISIRAWLSCTVMLLAVSGSAAEGPSALQAAKDCYRDADFQNAVSLLHTAVQDLESRSDVQAARGQLADAYLHLALSYCALRDADAAKDAFRKLLGLDRSRRLDPAIYAPKVIDLFERARLSLPPEPVAAALAAAPSPRPPRDRWLTLEWARQEARLSSREPFAGLGEATIDPASGALDLGRRDTLDGPARNTQYARLRLPWALGDITFERRAMLYGGYHTYPPTGDGPPPNGTYGGASTDSQSIAWSRPFWSGTTVWRRPSQHRWEVGYRHVAVEDHVFQDWWVVAYRRRGSRRADSKLRLHGARAGLATSVDLGRGWTLDLGLGGTVFFAGRDESHESIREPLYLPDGDYGEARGSWGRPYGLKVQGDVEARLQWDVLRLRQGALHLAVRAFHEVGGPAGSIQPNATIATRGISGLVGIDLGPRH